MRAVVQQRHLHSRLGATDLPSSRCMPKYVCVNNIACRVVPCAVELGGCGCACRDVEERVLLRRFRIATSRALDGVLDQLSSKNMTDAVRSQHGRRGTAVGTQHLCPASPSRGGMSGLAGVTTRPAGYPSSGVPPAVERQLHLLTQLRMQSCFRAIVHRAFRVHHAPHSLHSTGVQ